MVDNNNKTFLMDANIIINAHDLYYHMKRVPEFWEWLEFHAYNGAAKIPLEIINEIQGGKGALHAQWVKKKDVREKLVFDEDLDLGLLNHILEHGYGSDLTDVELEKIGMDPFLIAYALKSPLDRVVVSNEVSKPSKKRANRKIPDVCKVFGINCCSVFELVRELDFSTSWKSAT